MRVATRVLFAASLFAGPVLGGVPGAFAGDPTPPATDPVKTLIAKIDAARTAKDDGALSTAMKEIPPLYKGTQDAAVKDSLRKELGTSLKNAKMVESRRVALASLVETDDGAKAWGVLQPVFPAADAEDKDNWHVDVVTAAGALHPEAATPPLLELVKKAKQPALGAAAVTALGKYHTSKARVQHLDDLVKTVKLLVPSRAPGKNPSADTQAKWSAIGPAFGKACDELTGMTIGDPNEWIKKVDNTKDLKTLFKD